MYAKIQCHRYTPEYIHVLSEFSCECNCLYLLASFYSIWYSASEVPRSQTAHAGLYSETFLPRDENTKLKDLIDEVNAKRFPGQSHVAAKV